MLIAFAGFDGSGKSTASQVLVDDFGFTRVSLADPVRAMALAINPIIDITVDGWNDTIEKFHLVELVDKYGWDVAKRTYPEVRRLLRAIGTDAGRNVIGESVWIDHLFNRQSDLFDESTRYVIDDARFLNEAVAIQGVDGFLVWIHRPGLSTGGHQSNNGEVRDMADWGIHNNLDLDHLRSEVRWIAKCNGFTEHRR